MEGLQVTDEPALATIEALGKAKRFQEAVDLCSSLLATGAEDVNAVLRMRAYIFELAGEYEKASADREAVLRSGNYLLRDLYQAADTALEARNVELAGKYFLATLERGLRERNDWFRSAAMFYLAFLEMELGDFRKALDYLQAVREIEPGCALPIPGVGVVSLAELEQEIVRRRH